MRWLSLDFTLERVLDSHLTNILNNVTYVTMILKKSLVSVCKPFDYGGRQWDEDLCLIKFPYVKSHKKLNEPIYLIIFFKIHFKKMTLLYLSNVIFVQTKTLTINSIPQNKSLSSRCTENHNWKIRQKNTFKQGNWNTSCILLSDALYTLIK